MQLFNLKPSLLPIAVVAGALLAGISLAPSPVLPSVGAAGKALACQGDNAGLTLPPGFCATIFADNVGHARHLVVSSSGVVYVNTWSGRYFPNSPAPPGGFLLALKDDKGTGKADVIQRFGETADTGAAGGTGIGLYNGWLYAELNDRIIRYALPEGQLVPQGQAETILSGMPLNGDHPMHPFAIVDGYLYVDVATATNACQPKNRTLETPGNDPCTEQETRGGVWRYDANKTGQKFSPAERYATGIRNAEGFGIDTIHHQIFVTQHGRDQLHSLWPKLYQPEEEATLPSEEVVLLKQGGDYGWPKCYYDPGKKSLILAPEYGGDGKMVGICANKIGPYDAFPAHWAPNDMTFYDQKQFPASYQDGVFIAFHGSWNRAPYAQQGFNVVFQSLASGPNSGRCEIFAYGFAGPGEATGQAAHRPSGVAVGPDGALYVADDTAGRIYKIVYQGDGGQHNAAPKYTPCPSLTADPGPVSGATPTAVRSATADNATANLPVPPGATADMVVLGNRLYHGSNGATCIGCHGPDAKGTQLGPDLTDKVWLWSDGSFPGIAQSITKGVPAPKRYRSPMPALGGSQLTPQQVSAISAYIWALSHSK